VNSDFSAFLGGKILKNMLSLKVSIPMDGKTWIKVTKFATACKIFQVDLNGKNFAFLYFTGRTYPPRLPFAPRLSDLWKQDVPKRRIRLETIIFRSPAYHK